MTLPLAILYCIWTVRKEYLDLKWINFYTSQGIYIVHMYWQDSVQFSSVAQSCPTLCNPTNRSAPGLPVHHQLPEFTQTHVHRVGDAIQPSRPLSPLLLLPLPLIPPSIRVFSSESTLRMRWPEYCKINIRQITPLLLFLFSC